MAFQYIKVHDDFFLIFLIYFFYFILVMMRAAFPWRLCYIMELL